MSNTDDRYDGTFGVFAEVSRAESATGYPSLTLYTSRGESMFGPSLSAYWSLTLEEARELGLRLIEESALARGIARTTEDSHGFLPGEREDPERYRSYYAGDADTGRY